MVEVSQQGMVMAPTAETKSFHSRSSPHSGSNMSNQDINYTDNRDGEETVHRRETVGNTGSPSKNLKENESKFRMEFFKKEPSLYTHRLFKQAAVIFDALKHEKPEENPYLRRKQEEQMKNRTPEIPHIDFENAKDKKLAFELAFATLKFQDLLDQMLTDISFFCQYPEHREEEGEVMVMLQDFQSRKFQSRLPNTDEELDPDLQTIEEAIMASSVKLNASLARNRIKHQVVSIEHLLPVAVRDTASSVKIPVYLWVNQAKISVDNVVSQLTSKGFMKVSPSVELTSQTFCLDPHCDDLLTFSPEAREFIVTHHLVSDGCLVLQDKSSCYGPHSLKYLLSDNDDVIHVNVGSGATTAHLSSVLGKKVNHIWAFGNFKSDEDCQQVKGLFDKLKVKNVKVLPDAFLDTSPDDVRLKNAKVVLISAECSKSGVSNPVDFVVSEGEDVTILKDLSIGETDHSKFVKLIRNQGAVLKHAMRMSKVQAVVYCTRSVNEMENEAAIQKAIEYANTALLRKVPYRVSPPVLPFSGEDIDSGKFLDGKFIKVPQSETSNGCFVALITREPEEIKETAKDILERAAAKGLLGPKVSKARKEKVQGENKEQEVESSTSVKEERVSREKILHRRVRKAQPKISPTRSSGPITAHAKVQTRNVGYKGSVGTLSRSSQTRHAVTRTSESVVSRLFASKLKPRSPPPKQKSYIQEYQKVVKHPAPFR